MLQVYSNKYARTTSLENEQNYKKGIPERKKSRKEAREKSFQSFHIMLPFFAFKRKKTVKNDFFSANPPPLPTNYSTSLSSVMLQCC